jgi:putative hydrolase of the HAD superfamily
MNIKALIFDFDGLLVDTETPQLLVWQEIYRSYGAQLLLEEWVRCLGTSADAFDIPADLRSKADVPINDDELLDYFKTRSNEAIWQEKLRPGIAALLQQAQQKNLRMAIASSSNREWVQSGLARLDASQFFPVLCTSEDVARVKPDPELYLLALNRLQVDASQAIVFEDSPNGILAAKAAGLTCVAYPNPTSSHLDISPADLIVPSLESYPLEKILQHFNAVL